MSPFPFSSELGLNFYTYSLMFLAIIPETFAPVLLRKRAEKLRKETGIKDYTTEQELFQKPFSELLVETLVRPFRE